LPARLEGDRELVLCDVQAMADVGSFFAVFEAGGC
jgi:hypothetical protein